MTMSARDLRPAGTLANKFGVKMILFGGPGAGKTPAMNTAPRPVLLVTEPGMLSMRGSNVPAFEAFTKEAIKDFFDWFTKSNEARNYDTLGVDSLNNICEIILAWETHKQAHGLKAYGNMAEQVMDYCNTLNYMERKHIVLICKQGLIENGRVSMLQDGKIVTEPVMQKKPVFPGKDLNVRIPHMFDEIVHLGLATVQGKQLKAFHTQETPEIFARDRSGMLNHLEEPNLANFFAKCMKG